MYDAEEYVDFHMFAKMKKNPTDTIYGKKREIINDYEEKQDFFETSSMDCFDSGRFSSDAWRKNKVKIQYGTFLYKCGFENEDCFGDLKVCKQKPYNTGNAKYWGLCKKHYQQIYEKKLQSTDNQFFLYLDE